MFAYSEENSSINGVKHTNTAIVTPSVQRLATYANSWLRFMPVRRDVKVSFAGRVAHWPSPG